MIPTGQGSTPVWNLTVQGPGSLSLCSLTVWGTPPLCTGPQPPQHRTCPSVCSLTVWGPPPLYTGPCLLMHRALPLLCMGPHCMGTFHTICMEPYCKPPPPFPLSIQHPLLTPPPIVGLLKEGSAAVGTTLSVKQEVCLVRYKIEQIGLQTPSGGTTEH